MTEKRPSSFHALFLHQFDVEVFRIVHGVGDTAVGKSLCQIANGIDEQTITTESIKFSAQFAKRYSFLTLRFGIIESTGGIGTDFTVPIRFPWYSRAIEEALVLKIDAFNFSIEALRFPRLRATLRFTPFEHVYVNAGMDDILNTQNRDELTNRLISGRDFFVGAGVYFTDADIKSLLPVIPTP